MLVSAVADHHVGEEPAADGDVDEPGLGSIGVDRRKRSPLEVGVDQQHALRRRRQRGKRQRHRRGVVVVVAGDDQDAWIAALFVARPHRLVHRADSRWRNGVRARPWRPSRTGRRRPAALPAPERPSETSAGGNAALRSIPSLRREDTLAGSCGIAPCSVSRSMTRPLPAAMPRRMAPSARIVFDGGDVRFCGRVGLGNHLDVLGVDALLLAGLAGAHQKGFVDGAACLHVTLQFAQAHHGSVGSERVLLERVDVARRASPRWPWRSGNRRGRRARCD